jgi:hypothetical protein
MDERINRPEGNIEVGTAYEPNVDIRRSTLMGRDYETSGTPRILGAAPSNRVLHWGPIWAGLATTLVISVLLEALFIGLGFTGHRAGAGFGAGSAMATGWSTVIASFIGVFVGGYLTGYASDMRSRQEGLFNGFLVGVMTILAPLFIGIAGAMSAAQTAANLAPRGAAPSGTQVQNALTIAANSAWPVFIGGVIVLVLAVLGAYAGAMGRDRALVTGAKQDYKKANMVH